MQLSKVLREFTEEITSRELKWRNEFWKYKIPHFIHPNFLTIFRMVGAVFLVFFPLDKPVFVILIVLLFLTDYFDGVIARTQNKETDFGKWADPVADKMLIASIIYCLYLSNPNFWNKFIVYLISIETLILLLGMVLILFKKPIKPSPNIWSRSRFTLLAFGLILFLLNQYFVAGLLMYIGIICGFIAVVSYLPRVYRKN